MVVVGSEVVVLPMLRIGVRAGTYEENSYVSLTCPHCKVVFVQLTANDIKTTKASKCLKHLRVCKSYNESVPPPDKKQKVFSC